MLSASFVNEHVLIPLDALMHMQVLPTGSGKLVIKGEKAFLDLSAFSGGDDIPDVVIIFNGTPFNCTLKGTIGAEIT